MTLGVRGTALLKASCIEIEPLAVLVPVRPIENTSEFSNENGNRAWLEVG